MKTVRYALSVLTVLLLAAGYGASQFAFFGGETAAYAQRVDQPPVRMLSLILLLAAVALAFVRDEDVKRGPG